MTTVLADGGAADGAAVLRPHAEQEHRAELAALAAADDRPRPPGWRLSPWAVPTYPLGGTVPNSADGPVISPTYGGSRRLIVAAAAPLTTARTLRRLGGP